jgi:hypothetical protein
MSEFNDKLFVNLGASQARRRLKGFGYGVRKVETAGSNKAVVIHTATGQHLRRLQAKFADVGFSETECGLTEAAGLFDVLSAPEVTEEIVEPE